MTTEHFTILKNGIDERLEIIRDNETGFYNITKTAKMIAKLLELEENSKNNEPRGIPLGSNKMQKEVNNHGKSKNNKPAGIPAGSNKSIKYARNWFSNNMTNEIIEECKRQTGLDIVHYELAKGTPKQFAGTKIIIICKTHGEFKQKPNNHLQANGCPKCACTGFSKSQIEWLTFIEKLRGIKIQHAMNDGEYKIKKTRWLADGYCKETNTVFEYHGDFWHGNPTKYDPEFINTVCNKKMKTLYAATLKREQKIRDLGYNLEIMWESDWNQINKSIRCIQLKYRASLI